MYDDDARLSHFLSPNHREISSIPSIVKNTFQSRRIFTRLQHLQRPRYIPNTLTSMKTMLQGIHLIQIRYYKGEVLNDKHIF